MNLFERFTREAKVSFYGAPAEYELTGKVIECSHCGNTQFKRTRPFSMAFAVAISKPVTLECENCGKILWFSKAPRVRE